MKISIVVFLLAAALDAGEILSPAEKVIAQARESIKKDPGQPQGYSDLGRGLVRRARETGDPRYLAKADDAIAKSLKLAADDFETLKVRVTLLQARAEYETALTLATTLNRVVPDDPLVYGLMADAQMALGRYADAEKQVQWMIDLRRANLGGMVRGAMLREVWGDPEGAAEWLTSAYRLTGVQETEERAWLLVQLARVQPAHAGKFVNEALKLFPGYHLALAQQAEVYRMNGMFAEAAASLEVPARLHPRHQYKLGIALEQAGQTEAAARAFADFERRALLLVNQPDNANRELALYYADQALRPQEALRIARIEAARRQDVHTLDVLAWSLKACGKNAEAQTEMAKALKVGTKDPVLLAHSAAIRAKLP